MPKRIAIFVALVMMSAAGFAQLPTSGDAFIGYTFNSANSGWSNTGNLNGWELSLEGNFAPHFGLVGDVGTQYGTLQMPKTHIFGGSGTVDVTTRVVSYMFGPRVSMTAGRFSPFAQAMVGLGHLHEDSLEYVFAESCVADAVGGGVDYRIVRAISWRVQGDLMQTRFHGSRQEDTRISSGVVFKF